MALAALAAGVLSSNAQPVYSANIVGYVNIPVTSGFNTIANPLNNSIGNSLTNIIPPGPAFDGSVVSLWNGTTYVSYVIDSTFPTGVADPGDNFAVTPPVLNPGQAFFVNNTVGSNTVTLVGSVAIGGPGPGSVGLATNTLTSSPVQSFSASIIPVGGGIESTNFNLPLQVGDQVLFWTGGGYSVNLYGGPGQWYNGVTFNPISTPNLTVGQGFYYQNNQGANEQWNQNVIVQ